MVNPSVRTKAMDEAIRGFDGVESVRVNTLLLASVSVTEPTPWRKAPTRTSGSRRAVPSMAASSTSTGPRCTEGRVPSGDAGGLRQRRTTARSSSASRVARSRSATRSTSASSGVGCSMRRPRPERGDRAARRGGAAHLRVRRAGRRGAARRAVPAAAPDHQPRRHRSLLLPARPDAPTCPTRRRSRRRCPRTARRSTTTTRSTSVAAPPACGRSASSSRPPRRELDDDLPSEFAENGIGYFYISQERADLDEAVRETTRPTVTALLAFTIVAVLATVTIAGLMVARQQRRAEAAHRHLRAVGATRMQLTTWSATPLLLAAAAGTIGSAGDRVRRVSHRAAGNRSVGRPVARTQPSDGGGASRRRSPSRSRWRWSSSGSSRGPPGGPLGPRSSHEPRRVGSGSRSSAAARRSPPAWAPRSTVAGPAPAWPPCSGAWWRRRWRPPRSCSGPASPSSSTIPSRTGGRGTSRSSPAAVTATPSRTWSRSGWLKRTCGTTSSTTPTSSSTLRRCSTGGPPRSSSATRTPSTPRSRCWRGATPGAPERPCSAATPPRSWTSRSATR